MSCSATKLLLQFFVVDDDCVTLAFCNFRWSDTLWLSRREFLNASILHKYHLQKKYHKFTCFKDCIPLQYSFFRTFSEFFKKTHFFTHFCKDCLARWGACSNGTENTSIQSVAQSVRAELLEVQSKTYF